MTDGLGPSDPGVVVIGSINVDLTSHSPRLPRPGETVTGTDFAMGAGGKGANQALASARMGAATWLVGCVGDDVFRSVVMERLHGDGVHTDHVRTRPGVATGVAQIRVDGAGENDIVVVALANAKLTAADVDSALAALAGRVAVALIQLEIPLDVAVHAIRAAKTAGLTVIVDPAPAAPLPEEIYAAIDIVVPNEGEAGTLTGVVIGDGATAEQAGRWFVDRGCRHAVITMGRRGSVSCPTMLRCGSSPRSR